jgi:hypothetical protein
VTSRQLGKAPQAVKPLIDGLAARVHDGGFVTAGRGDGIDETWPARRLSRVASATSGERTHALSSFNMAR